jgi:hypothetical protein
MRRNPETATEDTIQGLVELHEPISFDDERNPDVRSGRIRNVVTATLALPASAVYLYGGTVGCEAPELVSCAFSESRAFVTGGGLLLASLGGTAVISFVRKTISKDNVEK